MNADEKLNTKSQKPITAMSAMTAISLHFQCRMGYRGVPPVAQHHERSLCPVRIAVLQSPTSLSPVRHVVLFRLRSRGLQPQGLPLLLRSLTPAAPRSTSRPS